MTKGAIDVSSDSSAWVVVCDLVRYVRADVSECCYAEVVDASAGVGSVAYIVTVLEPVGSCESSYVTVSSGIVLCVVLDPVVGSGEASLVCSSYVYATV